MFLVTVREGGFANHFRGRGSITSCYGGGRVVLLITLTGFGEHW